MISKGDTVYVMAPHRNIGDSRPCLGECEVVEYYPKHTCGPCVMVRDRHGETTVHERYTIPLAMRTRSAVNQ